jgi:orotate phosphoribosyltransferase
MYELVSLASRGDCEVTEQSKKALEIFSGADVILHNDHFVYISGDHGSGWVNKDVLYLRPENVRQVTELLATLLEDVEADVICGPATGGLIVANWLAFHMDRKFVFAEHDKKARAAAGDGAIRPPFVLRRHYDQVVKGRRVIVVDDIVNTGHSLRQTVAAVQSAGGEVVCASTLCTRGNVDGTTLGAGKFVALCEIKIPSWTAANCRLCRDGMPVNQEYAHGYEFVRTQK